MQLKEPIICPTFEELERIKSVRSLATALTLAVCALFTLAAFVGAETWLIAILWR